MDDVISRRAAIDGLDGHRVERHRLNDWQIGWNDALDWVQESYLEDLPSVQPEIKPIEYRDCANAMLKMWMDNVVTDGEYNRIMDKLNAHWRMKNERSD